MKIIYWRDCVIRSTYFLYNLQTVKYSKIKLTKICLDCTHKMIILDSNTAGNIWLVYRLIFMLEQAIERGWGYDLTEKKERLKLLKVELLEVIGAYEDLQKVCKRLVRGQMVIIRIEKISSQDLRVGDSARTYLPLKNFYITIITCFASMGAKWLVCNASSFNRSREFRNSGACRRTFLLMFF